MAEAAADYAAAMRGTRSRVLTLIAPYLAAKNTQAAAPKAQEAHDG